jgi:hypothetical protein
MQPEVHMTATKRMVTNIEGCTTVVAGCPVLNGSARSFGIHGSCCEQAWRATIVETQIMQTGALADAMLPLLRLSHLDLFMVYLFVLILTGTFIDALLATCVTVRSLPMMLKL